MSNSTELGQYWESIDNIAEGQKFWGWYMNGEGESESATSGGINDCNAYSQKQLAENGQTQQGPYTAIQMTADDEQQSIESETLAEGEPFHPALESRINEIGGTIYIMSQLKLSNVVMVGVVHLWDGEFSNNSDVVNVMSNHFIVITKSSVNDDGSVEFSYYENATQYEDDGTNLNENVLKINSDNSVTDSSGEINVTEVRKNN